MAGELHGVHRRLPRRPYYAMDDALCWGKGGQEP